MLTIKLYMRQNCPLCEQVEEDLQSLQAAIPHRLIRIDIEEEALAEFVDKIPVVEVGPYQLKAPIDKKSLEMTLGAASDRLEQMDEIQLADHQKRLKKGKKVSFADQLFYWLSRRYMLVFNAFVVIYVGLAFLAPILQSQGKITPAKLIYTVYGRLCHQLSYRSWFLFGEQAAYPRAIADVDGLVTYGEATGFDPFDVKRAISYLGDDRVGYKTALCQRDIGIYTGILLFGLVFSLTGRKIPGLPIGIWFVLGIVPIGLDGFSQIISQLALGPDAD